MRGVTFFKNLWKDEDGQSTTEYILILSIVVMIALKFRTIFATKLEGIVTQVTGNMEKAVQDGN
jgi:Flp pilus assembly pilin Flp